MNAADRRSVYFVTMSSRRRACSLLWLTLEGAGHSTFGGAEIVFNKSELVVFCETQLQFAVFVEHFSAPSTLPSASPPTSPLYPAPAFALVKTKTYSRAGTDVTVPLKAAMYFAFFLPAASSVGV